MGSLTWLSDPPSWCTKEEKNESFPEKARGHQWREGAPRLLGACATVSLEGAPKVRQSGHGRHLPAPRQFGGWLPALAPLFQRRQHLKFEILPHWLGNGCFFSFRGIWARPPATSVGSNMVKVCVCFWPAINAVRTAGRPFGLSGEAFLLLIGGARRRWQILREVPGLLVIVRKLRRRRRLPASSICWGFACHNSSIHHQRC